MANVNIDHLRLWVEDYYRGKLKDAYIGVNHVEYYENLKGYYKTKQIVDGIIADDFHGVDTSVWFLFLSRIKKGIDALESGGGFLRYKDYKDRCSQSSFYASRAKFLKNKFIIETPFSGYYILNPEYVIKMVVKKERKDEDNSGQD